MASEKMTATNNNLENTKDGKKKEEEVNGTDGHSRNNSHVFLLICIVGVSLGVALDIINTHNKKHTVATADRLDSVLTPKKYWVFPTDKGMENKTSVLKHVHAVLKRINYEISTNETPWDLLWSHDYPFRALHQQLVKLKPHQKVNHFPGSGFITSKVVLATTKLPFIPKAFELPKNRNDFLEYVSKKKDAMFVEKNNLHRGVRLKNVSEVDLSKGTKFVQEYITNPLLVDGHKFDIGVYVVVTSVDPLRVYWYKGDVLFRYCPSKYHPLDPSNLDQYVISDNYLPTWEVPSLARTHNALGFGMKDAFDVYARSQGKDTAKMWDDILNAIAEVFLLKETHIITALKNYPSSDNFFEMMRFDFLVDEDLRVYMLEANMSPNLSSSKFIPNQLLYEQLLYNLFGLTGVSSPVKETRNLAPERNMVSSIKNIVVWGDELTSLCKDSCEETPLCGLSKPCLTHKTRDSLLKAHSEFVHRGDFRRLLPPPMTQSDFNLEKIQHLTESNKLHHLWYQGKCNADPTWCT